MGNDVGCNRFFDAIVGRAVALSFCLIRLIHILNPALKEVEGVEFAKLPPSLLL